METSRLFVRGLPPSLTEEEFRQHFSQAGPVTDAKLIAHRRFGYVGYKTPRDAAEALRYHNRTFVRMSKITVEFAKSVAEQRHDRKRSADEPVDEQRRNGKDNFKHDEGSEKDPRLKEFLETMKPGKTRIWENDALDTTIAKDQEPAAKADSPGRASDTEYEPLPKRRKIDSDLPSKSQDHSKVDTSDIAKDAPAQPPTDPAASDADWLRTRTSRILGLEDDDDAESDRDDDHLVKGSARPQRTEAPVENAMSDASSQTDEDLHEPAPKPEAIHHSANQVTVNDRRLFIRNLSYHTTEDDLRDYFSAFGSVAEVSSNISFPSFTMMIPIGTAYVRT
jgi:multiple RNA-binding domain-containing protein 1